MGLKDKTDILPDGTFIRPITCFLAMFGVLILAGCATVGPDYRPPDTAVSAAWHTRLNLGLAAGKTDLKNLESWWTVFNDPALSGLINRAVIGNLDLKKARARIREARSKRGVSKSGLFPTLETSGSAAWSRQRKDTVDTNPHELYSAGFDAGWELDLFGGVRRSVEAAEANLQAGKEDLRDVLVSLLAEVTLNYIEMRTYQIRLGLAEGNLEAQKETHQLTLWRNQSGLSDDLAVQQALYNLESTRSQIPALRIGLEEAMNRIAVLLGERPGRVHEELEKQEPVPVTPLKIAIGVPAEMLRRRPDIRKAERQLAAQTARIGVATADLYPKFALSGSIGLEALSLTNLFSAGSQTYSFGPSITWPIFKAGAIRQNIEVQSALQEQYLIAYESAVLSALEEVENALVAFAEERHRRRSLIEATQSARKAVELAQYKYRTGLTDFSQLLDTQRALLSFQDQLAQSEGAVSSNLVRLYKALGGGWTSLAPDE